jgi:hypothetical protein
MDCCPAWRAFKKDSFKHICQIGQQIRELLLVVIASSSSRLTRDKDAWFQSLKPRQENEDEEKVPNGLMKGT